MTERQILRAIGKNVRTARMKAGLTQECLAELVGVHWQTLSYLETGKFPFSVITFVRLTHALDISANRLIDGVPEPDLRRIARIKKAKARQRRPRSEDIVPGPEPRREVRAKNAKARRTRSRGKKQR